MDTEALLEFLKDFAHFILTWFPWVLPFAVAIGLIVTRSIVTKTKNKIHAIKEKNKKPKEKLLTALELEKQYNELSNEEFMREIRSKSVKGKLK